MAGSNVPESRQLMINLMYLVLTALLALNVTREVLDAFETLNSGIERSNISIHSNSQEVYSALEIESHRPEDSAKVRPWLDKANKVKAETKSIITYLQDWKDSLISLSGGKRLGDDGDTELVGRSNIDVADNLFIEKNYGEALKNKLVAYKADMLNLIDSPDARKEIAGDFPLDIQDPPTTEDNPKGSWAFGTFHHIPVIAGVALMSKYQNDVRNSEYMLLERFRKQVHAGDLKFNAWKPIAQPNTTYALKGQKIQAQILLAAYNKNAKGLKITSTAGPVTIDQGVGHLEFTASGEGPHTVNGTITYQAGGRSIDTSYHFDYIVGTAGASLQLDKMNVMYIDVDNPITISASGYNIEDVSLDWQKGSGVTMKPEGKGHYEVRVTKTGQFKYDIVAKRPGGSKVKVGGGLIRVKRIPNPVPKVAGVTSGLVKTGTAKVQMGVNADLEHFDFKARFVVTSFQFIWMPQNGQALIHENIGALWDATVKQYIQRSRPGDRWIINNIKARGPGGHIRPIGSVTIKLN